MEYENRKKWEEFFDDDARRMVCHAQCSCYYSSVSVRQPFSCRRFSNLHRLSGSVYVYVCSVYFSLTESKTGVLDWGAGSGKRGIVLWELGYRHRIFFKYSVESCGFWCLKLALLFSVFSHRMPLQCSNYTYWAYFIFSGHFGTNPTVIRSRLNCSKFKDNPFCTRLRTRTSFRYFNDVIPGLFWRAFRIASCEHFALLMRFSLDCGLLVH